MSRNKLYGKTIRIMLVMLLMSTSSLFAAVLGDVNSSGSVDIVDALLIAQYYVGLNPQGFNTSVADVNADNSTNVVDALLIAQFYVGIITSFPGSNATPVPSAQPGINVSVYLASDSTVQTYSAAQAPQQGWGQRLQEFFTSNVTIVNKAIGGRSSKSFVDEGRLTEILNMIKPGDFLFCQWGINDRYTSDPTRYTDPATTFRTYLKMYIDGARGKNAIPVLITPTPRLDYVNGVFQNDFPAYCEAIKAVGSETSTPVIDLQTKALAYYTSIGYDAVVATISLDVLHFKTEGAYQMARLVAEGVKEIGVSLSPYVK